MPDSFDNFCSLWPGADQGDKMRERGMHPLTIHFKNAFNVFNFSLIPTSLIAISLTPSGAARKFKHFFPQNILLQLCYTLVHSQLLYGIIIWGNTFLTYMRKLTALQNRAVKVISGAHFWNSVKPLYVQYKILQIDDLYKLEVAKMVYCCIHNKAPSSFLNYFNKLRGYPNV